MARLSIVARRCWSSWHVGGCRSAPGRPGLAYRFDESGDQTVKRDFNFDGQEFTAGLAVDTGIKVDTYIHDVVYSVYRTEKLDVLVGGGIHALDLEITRARSRGRELEFNTAFQGPTVFLNYRF